MQNKTKAIFLTIGIILLGFFREYLFANINWIFLTLSTGRMNQARNEFQFLLDWSLTEINYLKFFLTLLFCFLFFYITYLIVNLLFKNKQFNKIVLFFHLALLAIVGLIFVFSKITNLYDTLYGSIRTIMGVLQSFLPLMILTLVFYFLPQSKVK
jgi:hypothetical protein